MFKRKQTELDGAVMHELIGIVSAQRGYAGAFHRHPFAETLYIVKGAFVLEYEGERRELACGSSLIIRQGVSHRVLCDGDGCMLYVGCSYIRVGGVVTFPLEKVREISDASVLASLPTVADRYLAGEDCYSVLHPLDEYWRGLALGAMESHGEDIIVERVKEYLEAHPEEQISVSALAKQFYLTPHYLGNKFCKCVGMTIKEYHTALRMNRALSLVKDSALSQSEIASRLGYSTLQYFSTAFKAYHGISPRSLRTGAEPTVKGGKDEKKS